MQDPSQPESFTSSGDLAFWYSAAKIYSIDERPGAKPTTFLDMDHTGFYAADSSYFYYMDFDQFMLWRLPLAGDQPASAILPARTYALSGDSIYGIDAVDNYHAIVLEQAPKAGGAWQRIRALGAGSVGNTLQIVGDRYFLESSSIVAATEPASGEFQVLTGSISSDNPPVRVLETSVASSGQARPWIGTAQNLYWTDGSAIYSRAVSP